MEIAFKKLSEKSFIPTKARVTDAGFDLYLPEGQEIFLLPNKTQKVDLEIASEITDGYYAQIRERSGLASKGVHIHGGVIDSEYRGSWQIIFHCTNINGYEFKGGDKIAQFTVHEVPSVRIVEVDTLLDSDRGARGFGSSGA